jgi:hypothetical protein
MTNITYVYFHGRKASVLINFGDEFVQEELKVRTSWKQFLDDLSRRFVMSEIRVLHYEQFLTLVNNASVLKRLSE